MAAIRGRDNKSTELALAACFRKNRIKGWRRQSRNVPGKPDFIFKNKHIIVFIDGCFWHGCKMHATTPKTNQLFWKNKISNNIRRDKIVNNELRGLGWTVIRIWEHDIKGGNIPLRLTKRLL